jgi:hypothetical protein
MVLYIPDQRRMASGREDAYFFSFFIPQFHPLSTKYNSASKKDLAEFTRLLREAVCLQKKRYLCIRKHTRS